MPGPHSLPVGPGRGGGGPGRNRGTKVLSVLNHKLSSITVISLIAKPFFLVPVLTLVSFVLCYRSLLGL